MSQLCIEAFRAIYDDSIYPPNRFSAKGSRSRQERESVVAIHEFNRKGVLAAPNPQTVIGS